MSHDWTAAEQTAFDVFQNAEEGDKIAWADRVEGCEVTDAGSNDVGERYLVAVGPAGGGPYVLRERYDDGDPDFAWSRGEDGANHRFERLEFTERWFETEDSEMGRHIGPTEYETLRRRLQGQAISAFQAGDYRDLDHAVSDVVEQHTQEFDDDEVRGVLYHGPGNYDTTDPAYKGPDRAKAADDLYQAIVEGAPRSALDDTVDPRVVQSDTHYENLVEIGAENVLARKDRPGIPTNELYYETARQLVENLPTADVVEIADTQSNTVLPSGDDQMLREFVIGMLSNDIHERVQEREKRRFRSPDGPTWRKADQYVTELAGHTITFDDLRRSWGISPQQAIENLKDRTPVLADGGQPHTLVDEINQVYGEEVPGAYNNWRLEDPGIVSDDEVRRMAWVNDETGDMLGLVGYDEREDTPSDQLDRWSVFYYDAGADSLTPVFSSDRVKEAIRFCREWISDGEEADFEVIDKGTEQWVKDNVDNEEVAEALFRSSGYQVLGQDIPIPTKYAAKRTGGVFVDTISYVARATGRTAERGARAAGSYVWQNYKEPIASAVGWLLLYLSQRAFKSALQRTRFGVEIDEDRVGVNTAYTYAPDDEEGTEIDWELDASKDRDTLAEKLRLRERTTWVLGLGPKQSDELWNMIEEATIDWGFMFGNPGELSQRERDDLQEGRTELMKTPDIRSRRSSSGGNDENNQGSSRNKGVDEETDGGETVAGSSPDDVGEVSTMGLSTTEEIEEAINWLDEAREEHRNEWEREFGGKARERGLDDPDAAVERHEQAVEAQDRQELRDAEVDAGIIDEKDREKLRELDQADRDKMVSGMHDADPDFSEENIDAAYEHHKQNQQSQINEFNAFPDDEEAHPDWDLTQHEEQWEDWRD